MATLAGDVGRAVDIIGSGLSVGWSLDEKGGMRAVIWDVNGDVTDLNDLLPDGSGWTLTEAQKIGEDGTIVGVGLLDGAQKTFLLRLP